MYTYVVLNWQALQNTTPSFSSFAVLYTIFLSPKFAICIPGMCITFSIINDTQFLLMDILFKNNYNPQQLHALDIYSIVRPLHMLCSYNERKRDYFWLVSVGAGRRLLNIDQLQLLPAKRLLADPMIVFSLPLQKKAHGLVLAHARPGGALSPSPQDNDLTDLLIQLGHIMRIPLLDHLLINDESYYSFRDCGLLDELSQSNKYVPDRIERFRYERAATERGIKQGRQERSRELARQMKKEGYSNEIIMRLSGLSKATVAQLKPQEEAEPAEHTEIPGHNV